MPDIKLSQVMAFSSEDSSFPAKNLLCSESYKKWKSKSAGEKEVSVLLKFENSSQIEAVHIGNEGSAFVEILVGKLGEDVRDFQVLLPTSSFMSPAESRSGTNPARVRMFERDKLSAPALDRPWDCARVVCTQPFCRTAAYGLSFVRFRCAEPARPRDEPQPQQPVRLGSFTLRQETEDTIRAGGLFKRRAELGASGGAALKRDDRSDRVVPPRHPVAGAAGSSDQPPRPSGHYQLKPEARQQPSDPRPAKTADTAKAGTSLQSPSAATPTRPNTAQKKAENTPNRVDTTPKRQAATPKRPDVAPKKPDTTPKRDQKAARGTSASSSAPASNGTAGSGDASATPRPPPNATYRPFKKLLAGVVFAMSGYQNPQRAELREQGVKLGASYRPDWGTGCTHLICAFRNTPKFSAVRGRGKIVRGEWLTACTKQKRRLPWRRFATDPADGKQPDSGDELWAEELRPPPPPGAGAPQPSASSAAGGDDDEYGGSTDDDEIDTDDEIRMAQETIAKASTSAADPDRPVPSPSDTTAKKRRLDPPQPSAVTEPHKRSSPAPSSSAPAAKRAAASPAPSAKRSPLGSERAASPAGSDDAYDAETDEDEPKAPSPAAEKGDRRPDTAGMKVPDLPDFLRGRTFLLYGDIMSSETRRQAARAVTAFGGKLEQYFGDSIKYVITEDMWDGNFDEAAADHPELMFVRPAWLEACAKRGKFVPLQPYLVTASV